MKLIRLVAILMVAVCANSQIVQAQTKLNKKALTLIVSYGYVGCTCAQWVINNRHLKKEYPEYIYLEPANHKLTDAESLVDGSHSVIIKISGHFYMEKGYPKNYHPAKGRGEAARVFRYDKIQNISAHK